MKSKKILIVGEKFTIFALGLKILRVKPFNWLEVVTEITNYYLREDQAIMILVTLIMGPGLCIEQFGMEQHSKFTKILTLL